MSPITKGRLVKGILIDITGVLYESGTTVAINGSIEALNLLREARIPFKFVTNETQNTRFGLAKKLQSFGFTVSEDDIFAPAPAVREYLIEKNLVPHLLVHPCKFAFSPTQFLLIIDWLFQRLKMNSRVFLMEAT